MSVVLSQNLELETVECALYPIAEVQQLYAYKIRYELLLKDINTLKETNEWLKKQLSFSALLQES